MKVHFVPLLEQFKGRSLETNPHTGRSEIEEAINATVEHYRYDKGWWPANLDIFLMPKWWPWDERWQDKIVIFPSSRQDRWAGGWCTNAARLYPSKPAYVDEPIYDRWPNYFQADEILVAFVER